MTGGKSPDAAAGIDGEVLVKDIREGRKQSRRRRPA